MPQLSKNFHSDEFKCRDGSEHEINPKLITILQTLRDTIKKPIHINSGYRSPAYNKKIGGAPKSQHMLGNAADISVSGVAPVEIQRHLEKILGNFGGLGLYKTFVHVDCRQVKTRWNG